VPAYERGRTELTAQITAPTMTTTASAILSVFPSNFMMLFTPLIFDLIWNARSRRITNFRIEREENSEHVLGALLDEQGRSEFCRRLEQEFNGRHQTRISERGEIKSSL
ncbi:MAG: hypothetical protein K8I82_16000, partial [Anaerolineae bacterium]|nr:hypothetical protein [Anaerolineae bacterium]